MEGDVLWTPPADLRTTTQIGRFLTWLQETRGLDFNTYRELHAWSVADLEGFWDAVVTFHEVRFHSPPTRVLGRRTMPGAQWFPGSTLNYAEHMLGLPEDRDRVAVIGRSQTRPHVQLTFGELADQVARVRTGLASLGIGRGDCVAAYMPNIPETLIAFIATASLGATWAACATEFGPRSVMARFQQVEPKVLLAVPGYGYRDRYISRAQELAAIRDGLPTLTQLIGVAYGSGVLPPDALPWDELVARAASPPPLEFEHVPFDHPLYILFSSGTTGLPKAIIHSHGGQLVEHLKHRSLGWDLGPESRLLWFATTSWMMWNALVSALLLRSSIVMLDGDPTWPDLMEQWRLAQELRPTNMGVSPPYLMACRKTGLLPGRELDLSSIRILHTAGSPVPAEGYRWAYEHLDARVLFDNGTGGTDICSGFAEACPATPVYEGEISAPCLAVDLKAFDADGNEVVGELGEMVVTSPLPSMPVGFCGDPDGSRLRETYFDRYPGVWRQGDWIRFTERGSCVVTGRSDATLNRGGVRLGTGEFYLVLEGMPEVRDSLVVHLEDPAGGTGSLLLFIVPSVAGEADGSLEQRINDALRSQLSPRHVPDRIIRVPAVPTTLTGKKLETPVKRILDGQRADAVASRDALLDPSALDAFVAIAQELQEAGVGSAILQPADRRAHEDDREGGPCSAVNTTRGR